MADRKEQADGVQREVGAPLFHFSELFGEVVYESVLEFEIAVFQNFTGKLTLSNQTGGPSYDNLIITRGLG
jgi:hypothetical protein